MIRVVQRAHHTDQEVKDWICKPLTLQCHPAVIRFRLVFTSGMSKVKSKVKEALIGQEIPPGKPPNRLFVPKGLRGLGIHWANTSLISCNPGVCRTMFHIGERFWWPVMRKEVSKCMAACSICAQNKTSSNSPAGLLRPLPVPLCAPGRTSPWTL